MVVTNAPPPRTASERDPEAWEGPDQRLSVRLARSARNWQRDPSRPLFCEAPSARKVHREGTVLRSARYRLLDWPAPDLQRRAYASRPVAHQMQPQVTESTAFQHVGRDATPIVSFPCVDSAWARRRAVLGQGQEALP